MNVKIFSINSNACCYLTIAIYSEREYRGVFPEKENVVLKYLVQFPLLLKLVSESGILLSQDKLYIRSSHSTLDI